MHCPYCATAGNKVVDSRPAEDNTTIRRRRECTACRQRFSTYERVDHAPLTVRKRSGALQPFDPDRIQEGMQRATANLNLPSDAVRYAAARVEARLRGVSGQEMGSDVIGGQVLEALRELHPVAYMRFASVHKSFTSAEDFARELQNMEHDSHTDHEAADQAADDHQATDHDASRVHQD